MTDDLTAFLNARLNEDEAAAKAAASVAGPGWKAETYSPDDESRTRTCVRSEDGAFLAEFGDTPDYPDLATHVARHDPGRALREVEAMREILTTYIKADAYGLRDDAWIAFRFAAETLAAIWSDHPDYRQEWKP